MRLLTEYLVVSPVYGLMVPSLAHFFRTLIVDVSRRHTQEEASGAGNCTEYVEAYGSLAG